MSDDSRGIMAIALLFIMLFGFIFLAGAPGAQTGICVTHAGTKVSNLFVSVYYSGTRDASWKGDTDGTGCFTVTGRLLDNIGGHSTIFEFQFLYGGQSYGFPVKSGDIRSIEV